MNSAIERLPGSLYDYPHYYDLVFGSDWQAELKFLRRCFASHAQRKVRRLFEPACGTGRLLFRLGKAGYRVGGLDLNPRAVAYCNRRLTRHGLGGGVFVADMSDFRLPRQVDAAFNMINSFRHLRTNAEAESHLRCIAAALAPGGIYVLGLHLTPTKVLPEDEERWSARRGHLQVNTHLKCIARDAARREERFALVCDVYTPSATRQLAEVLVFRSYTAPQFRRLLKRVPELEVAAAYDFSYNLQQEIDVDGSTEDVVYVLRRLA
jgi:SAM-dependent methyltransferase